ncbi:hypothetical protein QBC45DRAFT_407800 [Copromyces sp. CBS 386.78]|nr:hypothetical protein QBC45DRAFT_407800 [Copromyces sp. CBS 386.78]
MMRLSLVYFVSVCLLLDVPYSISQRSWPSSLVSHQSHASASQKENVALGVGKHIHELSISFSNRRLSPRAYTVWRAVRRRPISSTYIIPETEARLPNAYERDYCRTPRSAVFGCVCSRA